MPTVAARLRLRELPSVGVSVEGVGAAELLEAMEEDRRRELAPEREGGPQPPEDGTPAEAVLKTLGGALREHSLLWLHADGAAGTAHSLTPSQLRRIYLLLHEAAYPGTELVPCEEKGAAKQAPPPPGGAERRNLRGIVFPDHAESAVLGFAESVDDYHGLYGTLHPRSWWERASGELHHDGAFSARSRSVPRAVMMCDAARAPGTRAHAHAEHLAPPRAAARAGADAGPDDSRPGGRYCEESAIAQPAAATVRSSSETGETLECPAASTLFYLTRRAMLDGGAPPGLAERARRVRCVYTEGFGRVRQGQYPRMSPSYLTALEPPLGPKEDREHKSITEFGYGAGETHWLAADTFADCCEKDEQEMERDVFRHSLVQRDEDGRECVVVTWTCLNCLEELDDAGAWRQLEYEDARTLIEGLLGRASAPPHLLAVDWAPGDCVIFDNLCVQHSVTPTDAYAFAPNRRLMVRTAVEPRRLVLRTLPAVRPLPSGCGARVEGLGAADVLEAMELEERDGGGAVTAILTEGLRAHGMLWFRGSERPGRRSLSPAEIQGLYERIHKSRYPEYDFAAMKEDEGTREEEARQPRATLPSPLALTPAARAADAGAVDGDNAGDAAFKSKDGNISRSKVSRPTERAGSPPPARRAA